MQLKEGQVVVVTGAGSGLGRAFALYAAGLGLRLALADVQEDALTATRQEVEARGAVAIAVRTDVSKASQVEAFAQATMAAFGAVHLVLNNAGVAAGGLLWEHSLNDWEWILGVNLWGVIHGIRTFTPLMLAQAERASAYRGHIVNTSSMAGLVSPPLFGAYSASKHAVVALTETLYQDLALVTDQIGCSVLCPYFIPTGIREAERNRPAELGNASPPTRSQTVMQAFTQEALAASSMTAERMAELTFEAVSEGRFYIYSHPHALRGVKLRMEDILAMRNPSDPLGERSALRARLGNCTDT